MRWIYKTVHYELKKEGLLAPPFLDENEIEESLNQYGKSGWELVSTMEISDGILAIFKQPFRVTRTAEERVPHKKAEAPKHSSIVKERLENFKIDEEVDNYDNEEIGVIRIE